MPAALLLIAMAGLLAYYPTFSNDFTNWDDHIQVTENPHIRQLSPSSLKHIFTSFYVQMYQPVTTLTYAVDYQISGLDPVVFHATSLCYHLLASGLFFLLLWLLTGHRFGALLAALIFVVHPLNVEPTVWISSRNATVCNIWYLASLVAYLRYLGADGETPIWKLDSPTMANVKWLIGSGGLFVLALLSKPTGVTVPVLMVVLDFVARRPLNRAAIVEKVPFFALSLVFGLVTIHSRGGAEGLAYLAEQYPWRDRPFLVSYATLFYLSKMVVPSGICAFYPYPLKSGGALPSIYYVAPLILLIAAGCAWRFRAHWRLWLLAASFYLVPMALVLQVVPTSRQMMADRYAYVSFVGFAVLLVAWAQHARTSFAQRACAGASIVFAIVLTVICQDRVRAWQNSWTLWNDVIARSPNAAVAYNNRGMIYKQRDELDAAFKDFSHAVNLDRAFADAQHNLGLVKRLKGDLDGAMGHYNEAIAYNPEFPSAYSSRGNIYMARKQYDKALADYTKALSLDTGQALAWANRAVVHTRLGAFDKAVADASRAIALDPIYTEAYFNRGTARLKAGQMKEATADLRKTIELAPAHVSAWANLGYIAYRSGKLEAAEQCFSQAVKHQPNNLSVLMNRAQMRLKLGKKAKACADFQRAAAMGSGEAKAALGRHCRPSEGAGQ